MIDIHSHIIPGVDDGSTSMEQSLRMVEEAERLGIRVIIATPHYHETIYEIDRVEECYQELLSRAEQYEVDIRLGYEVFVNPKSPSILRIRRKLSLYKTGRILIEFPFNAKPSHCIEVAKRLRIDNLVPVIAHPERNRSFMHNFGDIVTFIKLGCLIQVDAASIVGVYGSRVEEFTKRLIKMNLVDMVASNAHCSSDYSNWFMKAYNNVIGWAGQESASKLFYQNPRNLFDGTEDNSYKNLIG